MMRYLMIAFSLFASNGYGATGPTYDEVQLCVQRNFAQNVFRQSFRLDVLQQGVMQQSIAGELLVDGRADELILNAGVLQPADLAGTAMLLREHVRGHDAAYLYIPSLRVVRQLTAAMAGQQLWGSGFNYLDFQHLYGTFPAGTEMGFDPGEWQEHSTYSRGVIPDYSEQSVYHYIRFDIDREHCVVAVLEFENAEGQLVKRLEGDMSSLIEFDGGHVLGRYILRDMLRGTETRLQLGKPELLEGEPNQAFSPEGFFQVHAPTLDFD
ncbi:MAG: outer membrane lipoprotein-sorting protein [Oceanococcus sp.]